MRRRNTNRHGATVPNVQQHKRGIRGGWRVKDTKPTMRKPSKRLQRTGE